MTETEILSVPLRLRLARRERSEWGSTAPIRLPRNPIRGYHAAAQGAPVQRDTRRWRRRSVCRTCPAGRDSRSYFMRLVRLSYLAPDITKAILDGRQPGDLTAEKLLSTPVCHVPGTDQDRARLCLS